MLKKKAKKLAKIKTTKKSNDEVAVNPLLGKTFLSIERARQGWVARKLEFTEDDVIIEKLNDPGSYIHAQSRFAKAYRKIVREEAKGKRDESKNS